jgi:hypothetical protein
MNACLTAGSRFRAQNGRKVDRRGIEWRKGMPRKFSVLLGLCVATALLAPAGASAATVPVDTAKIAGGTSAIEKTHYRHHHHHYRPGGYGRCRAWRHECASRWGWGGHGFRRCLWRHGC